MKSEIEAKIEYQEIIGEAKPGGYQPVRFTRVKYKASPDAHIDIRRYQRGSDSEGEEAWFPTKIGFRFPERDFRRVVCRYALLPENYVHPLIAKKSFALLKAGQFEGAVLQAFKLIETTTRSLIKAPSDEVGVKLLRRAFNPDSGPLTDLELPRAEREAFSNYISGAFAYYRNSCSHRDVQMDAISAFERLVVASNLLKTIESAGDKANV